MPLGYNAFTQQTEDAAASALGRNGFIQPVAGPGGAETVTSLTVTGLTASRLVATDGSKTLSSVANLASWIAGTSNQLTVTDDGDGTITLSLPQNIHTAATPQFAGLTLSSGAQGSVLFYGAGGVISQNNASLFWDNANLIFKVDNKDSLLLRTTGDGLPYQGSSAIGSGLLKLENAAATGWLYHGHMSINNAWTGVDTLSYGWQIDVKDYAGNWSALGYFASSSLTIHEFQVNNRADTDRIVMNFGSQGPYFGTEGATTWYLVTNRTARWALMAAGHILPSTDNAYTVGDGTNRVLSFSASFQFNIYAASADANPTSRLSSGTLSFGAGGASALDTIFVRDAANIFALKNDTNAQTLRIYGTTTASKYMSLSHGGTDATLGTNAGTYMTFLSSGVIQLDSSAKPASDNVLSLGTTSLRYLDGHFVSISLGTTPGTAGALRIPYTGNFTSRNADNNGDLYILYANTQNSVKNCLFVGDTTAGVLGQARSGGAAPTTSDLPAGFWTVWRDTVGGTTKVYYNNGGAIIASVAFL